MADITSKQKVLLLGATGETGGDILNGLLEDGGFEVSCLIQPSSATKPAVAALRARSLPIIIADLQGPLADLAAAITGFPTIISAISAWSQHLQSPLVNAAALTGTCTRFLPCAFMTVCPPGGVMQLRDDKEAVYRRLVAHGLRWTVVDVGFWHQLSWFGVPSGRFEYAALMKGRVNEVFAGGEARTLVGDKRDIGRWLSRIIKDERTVNRMVYTWSDFLSQNEIVRLIEEKTGEKVEVSHISEAELLARRDSARAACDDFIAANPGAQLPTLTRIHRSQVEYNVSKFIRQDNTPETAKQLGYLDARKLYPDFNPVSFEKFLQELMDGTVARPYGETLFQEFSKKN